MPYDTRLYHKLYDKVGKVYLAINFSLFVVCSKMKTKISVQHNRMNKFLKPSLLKCILTTLI